MTEPINHTDNIIGVSEDYHIHTASNKFCLSSKLIIFGLPRVLMRGVVGGATVAVGLQAASKTLDAARIFLLTQPSAPDANLQIQNAATSALLAILFATCGFSLTLIFELARNRMYMRATPHGIQLTVNASIYWFIGAIALVLWTRAEEFSLPLLYSVLSGLVGFELLRRGSLAFASARRYMLRDADEILQTTHTAPILYLRRFDIDEAPAPDNYSREAREKRLLTWRVLNPSFWSERREWTFEEVLCKAMSTLGPVIAIGRPGEKLPKLGAARKYVADSDWQREVLDLMKRCRFACLVIASSDGLLWEFQQLVSAHPPNKVLLIIPRFKGAESTWSAFVERARQNGMNIALPNKLPENMLAVSFTKNWQPVGYSGVASIQNYRGIAHQFQQMPD